MALSYYLSALLILHLLLPSAHSISDNPCAATSRGECYNKPYAMRLKFIAIASILITSLIGVCLPLFSRSVPALRPGRNLFVIVKAFASGVILATGYMHVLPDSFDDLKSPCLPENPWAKFPFTTFVAMVSAVITLMLDSLMMSYYKSSSTRRDEIIDVDKDVIGSDIRKNRIIAQVLEMGIVVHSVVIGLSMGASQNPCTIRPLIAALCFHQMFEGMGLGGCILQAEYDMKMRAILVFFFATTTPLGTVLGIAVSNVYSSASPTALIVEGVLNAVSAGILNYMALVELLSVEFMGPRLQSSVRLQLLGYAAVFAGAGLMSLMAKWA
ncbi:fe(2+) transport protein 1-like [Typha latifolia]|uniref:fe(2+) transport protein 1-like n=1 Tax=Typha latifolia TaxID=4733 RepID=UPI003C2B6A89